MFFVCAILAIIESDSYTYKEIDSVKKKFVLDTNILLSDPDSIFKFEDNDIVIPISVIEEIDSFKKDQSETGRNARYISRSLDKLRALGRLSNGVPLAHKSMTTGGLLYVDLGRDLKPINDTFANTTDNNILSVALSLQEKEASERKIVLITRDSNLRIKSDAYGIASDDFLADKVDISELYTGILPIEVENAQFDKLKAKGSVEITNNNLYSNQFVIVEKNNEKLYGVFNQEKKTIQNLSKSTERNVWGLSPKNMEQSFALWALLNDDIKLVTITGGAGTGKTLLAIASGLSKSTDEDIYSRLLVSRPIFPLGKDLGFLPGDLDEKLNPWMKPVYDCLDFLLGGGSKKAPNKSYDELINQGILTLEALTYIRGRSLPHSFFIVDEAQNLTPHEIKTIMTRAGEGTKIVLTGDPFQIDNPYVDSTNNGLTYVVERFKTNKISAHITLKRGERSELASLAAQYL
jgi:PhoH-like ATPase